MFLSFSGHHVGAHCLEGKQDIAKRVQKTVTRGCELRPGKERFEERFESMSFRIEYFSMN